MILDYFEHKMQHHCIKMKSQKIVNFLDTTSYDKDLPRFVTKKWVEVSSSGDVTVGAPNNAKKLKQQHLKTMHHLSTAFQKLMAQKLIMQKIWML